ncbi:hypothetical protein I4U23_022842 [Adineta vaga]|nr:hypothetical protein I4U23_022842 [Adineta vaga]
MQYHQTSEDPDMTDRVNIPGVKPLLLSNHYFHIKLIRQFLLILICICLGYAVVYLIMSIIGWALTDGIFHKDERFQVVEASISILFYGFGLFVTLRSHQKGLRVFGWLGIILILVYILRITNFDNTNGRRCVNYETVLMVDTQSIPVNLDKRSLTTIIDAQSGQLDHPVKNPSSSVSDVPPTITSVNGYRLGDVTQCFNINGYSVVSDGILFEKQQTFNRSKIVERAVHVCGSGAFGYFEVTRDVSSLCKADFLSKVGKIAPVFIRFSTTTYGREYPDSARNPRGIAMRFYTDEGNYDILSINFPVLFSTVSGINNFPDADAIRMCREDPDYAKRDLWQHLDNGGTCEFRCHIQVMNENEAENAPDFDPFDTTKMWSEDRYPLMEFGRIVLDRNPESYHLDVEQVAFSPGNLVPGIEPSPDALLQFRCFLYRDAQLYRLGVNFHQIPVNCPFMTRQHHPLAHDGRLRCDANGGVESNIYPNSYTQPPHGRPDLTCNETPQPVQGYLARKFHS